jgi:hypothetical protein
MGALVVTLAGGALMLLAAAIIHAAASVPLLVIGGAWFAMGLGALWQRRRIANEVRLAGDRITFVYPTKELTMHVEDLLEIRRSRWDPNRWQWLLFQTRSHGTIKVAARLRGLFDLLSELRRLNPRVTYPDF